jgi:hypothetical protein
MGQFSAEKPVLPGSVLSGNQHSVVLRPPHRASGLTHNGFVQSSITQQRGLKYQIRRGLHSSYYFGDPQGGNGSNDVRDIARGPKTGFYKSSALEQRVHVSTDHGGQFWQACLTLSALTPRVGDIANRRSHQ